MYHVSDQGTHFKNKVVSELNRPMQTENHFVTAYNHQATETIKRVNREMLEVLKSLLSELCLSEESRPGMIPSVQSALNHASLPCLGGLAAIIVFTGLPAQNQLDVMWIKDQDKFIETSEDCRRNSSSDRFFPRCTLGNASQSNLDCLETSNTEAKEI